MKLMLHIFLLLATATLATGSSAHQSNIASDIEHLDELDNKEQMRRQKLLKLLYYVNEAIDSQMEQKQARTNAHASGSEPQQYVQSEEQNVEMTCKLRRYDYSLEVWYDGLYKQARLHLQFNNNPQMVLASQINQNQVVQAYLANQQNFKQETKLFRLVDIVVQICKGKFGIQAQQIEADSTEQSQYMEWWITFKDTRLSYLTPSLYPYPDEHEEYQDIEVHEQQLLSVQAQEDALTNETVLKLQSVPQISIAQYINQQGQQDQNQQQLQFMATKQIAKHQQSYHQSDFEAGNCLLFASIFSIAMIVCLSIKCAYFKSESSIPLSLAPSGMKCKYSIHQFSQQGSLFTKKIVGDWARIALSPQTDCTQLRFKVKNMKQWPICTGIVMTCFDGRPSNLCILYSSDRTLRVGNEVKLGMGRGFKHGQTMRVVVDSDNNAVRWQVEGEVRFAVQLPTKLEIWDFVIDVRGVKDAIQLL